MSAVTPESPEELAAALSAAAAKKQTITLGGRFSKNRMAGPVERSDVTISTAKLARVLSYEPKDLTISVEAGLPWAELTRLLAENRQMVPLDPPFSSGGTVGGVVSANCSGPRRRLYGTARDLVFLLTFATLDAAIAGRDRIMNSVLQPASIDLLNPAAAQILGWFGHILAVQAGGNALVIERYEKELRQIGSLRVADVADFTAIQEFTPWYLATFEKGAVVRISCTLSQIGEVMKAV